MKALYYYSFNFYIIFLQITFDYALNYINTLTLIISLINTLQKINKD